MSYTTLEDIEALARDGVAESLTLEFKAAAALSKTSPARNELVKDVTAMANSAGGVIIYGMREADGCAAALDLPGIDTSIITPEWIGQILDSNTSPRVQGVTIKAIATSGSSGHAIYVVTVPQATSLAPHQSGLDQKYYRRFDQRAVPMHDYEIRDVLRRGHVPDLEVRLSFPDGAKEIDLPDDHVLPLRIEVENLSIEPSLYTHLEVNFQHGVQILAASGWKLEEGFREHLGVRTRQINMALMVPKEFPIVRGSTITLGPQGVALLKAPNTSDMPFVIVANVLAPGCVKSFLYTITRTSEDMVVLEFIDHPPR